MKKRLLSIVCVVLVIILYLQYGTRAQILSTFNNTDMDAYLTLTECKQLIRHAIDLSDVIVDDLEV